MDELTFTEAGEQWLAEEVNRQSSLLGREVTRQEVIRAALRAYSAVPMEKRRIR